MSGDDPSDPDGPVFRRAMRGVEPKPFDPRRDGATGSPVRRPPRRPPDRPAAAKPAARWWLDEGPDGVSGRIDGFGRARLRRLRAGREAIGRRVDLHGLTVDAAERVVQDAVRGAAAARQRCLLVIHGKGDRELGSGAIRRAVPGWLTDPRLGRSVVAFCPATPRDGGSGATYVLLRRPR